MLGRRVTLISLLMVVLLTACDVSTPAPSTAASAAAEASAAPSSAASVAEASLSASEPASAAGSSAASAEPSAVASNQASVQASAAASAASPEPSAATSSAASAAASSAASAEPSAAASSAASAEPSASASAAASAQGSAAAGVEAVIDLEAAAEYCVEQGGVVVPRYPLFGTNLPSASQLRLGGSLQFCQFERSFDESPEGFRSRISIALSTLYTELPTLATVAYLNGPPPQPTPTPSVNPGSFYCSQLGGTDLWGGQGSASGGAWRTDDSAIAASAFGPDLEACVFPDGSIIDSFGLFYRNANGTVRGTDLAEVIRYRPEGLPPLYPSSRPTAELPEANATPPAFPSPSGSELASEAAVASSTPAASAEAFDPAAAEAFCVEQGGRVVVRRPVWGTNGPPARQVELSGSRAFCNFERAEPDSEDSDFRSQIEITLDTLYSAEPSMAMLAYLTPRPVPRIPDAVNPASAYCSLLGGTTLFGGASNGAGGGWVKLDDTSTAFDELSMCVFPDLSSIDEWGLTYNAFGTVRGADLASVARYQPAEAPLIFPDGRPRAPLAQASPGARPTAASNTVAIDETSNNSTVTLEQGQELVIALQANPSTGFAWEADQLDQAVLRETGAAEFGPVGSAAGLPGAPQIETLRFRAVGAGETTLTLVYRRPFEPPTTPTSENLFTLRVTVR